MGNCKRKRELSLCNKPKLLFLLPSQRPVAQVFLVLQKSPQPIALDMNLTHHWTALEGPKWASCPALRVDHASCQSSDRNMSGSIASKEHAARGAVGLSPWFRNRSVVEWGIVWATDHNGALAFGSRPVRPTKLQMCGDDLVI